MQRYVQRREAPRAPPPRIDFVRVDPGSERYGPAANSLFDGLTGKPLDPDAVARRVTALYGRGGLDTLDYHVIGTRAATVWRSMRARIPGSDYLRFGLSCRTTSRATPLITPPYALSWRISPAMPANGSPTCRSAPSRRFRASCSWPLAQFSGWFVMPHAADQSRDVDVLQGQNLLAEYRVHRFDYGLDFGHQFGNWGEIRTGVQREQGHFRLKIGDPADPGLPQRSFAPSTRVTTSYASPTTGFDDVNFPHRGQRATLQWSGVRNASGASRPPIR